MLIAKPQSMKKSSTVINTITHSQRYLPHELNTKFFAVQLYRTGVGVFFVCRRYHISKSSLMRWNKKFNGTKKSLISHRYCLYVHPCRTSITTFLRKKLYFLLPCLVLFQTHIYIAFPLFVVPHYLSKAHTD